MESKWYFFSGQTPENTKISDRAHALHLTATAWEGITQHQDRKKRIQEAIDREKAHRQALKEGSEKMTKEWANSIENIHLRKEQERRERMDKKKEDKIQMFYKLREEQEIIRKEYVEKVRKQAFIESGRTKELNSALILSETLYEREKQKEFKEECRKHEEEMKARFEQEIIASDEKQRQQDKERKQKKREEERKMAQTLRDQIQENEETRKANNRAHVEREIQDCTNAAREEKLIKEFEIEEKKRKRHEMALEKKKALTAEYQRHEILRKENAEMEKATQFYSEAKYRIDCLLKSKAKEMQQEAIKQREALALQAAAIQEAKDAAEDERIATVVAERMALEKAKEEETAAVRAQAVKDRIEDRKRYLERLENEKRIDHEMKRWELLNRCKTKDAIKEYDDQNRREKWAKILEYRKDLLEQMVDDNETKKREKEIDDILSHISYAEADKMFFDYANEVLELAKNKNRPTYPIEKVITGYKKVNNLIPPTSRCSCKKY